jgi:serine/threonine protein kinase
MIIKIFSELVIAVSMFHINNLAHFDLKPANIFIDENMDAILGIDYFLDYLFYK